MHEGGVAYTASEIAAITGGLVSRVGTGQGQGQGQVEPAKGSVCTDTRTLRRGQWILALKGEYFDCHDVLPSLAPDACVGAIGARPAPDTWAQAYVQVEDSLLALQELAADVRAKFEGRGPVVAITGSCGKTTTRRMTELALAHLGEVHATQGNFNNHIGLPLTLLAMPPSSKACVLELGMSQFGEIARLADICAPTIRLVTNVGAAHTQGVGGLDGVARAKGELFLGAREGDVCIVNDSDARVSAMHVPKNVRVVRFGTRSSCDVWVDNIHPAAPSGLSTQFQLHCRGQSKGSEHIQADSTTVQIEAPGEHLALNAAAAAAVGLVCRVPLHVIGTALGGYSAVGQSRMHVERAGGVTVINDTYNANPLSMSAALQALSSATTSGRRVAILGDMKELGADTANAHLEVLQQCVQLRIDILALVGPAFTEAYTSADHMFSCAAPVIAVLTASDSEEISSIVLEQVCDGDLVLVKGSRSMRMELVVHALLPESG